MPEELKRCPGCGSVTTTHLAECQDSVIGRSVHKAAVEYQESLASRGAEVIPPGQMFTGPGEVNQVKAGVQQQFPTGAVRDTNAGKGRPDLISPVALRRLAMVMQKGAEKYKERNWERGIDLGRLMESTLRHLNQYLEGDRSEDHLGHAMFGAMALIHTEEMIARGLLDSKLDNLPRYLKGVPKE
jgi:hypothetical protein